MALGRIITIATNSEQPMNDKFSYSMRMWYKMRRSRLKLPLVIVSESLYSEQRAVHNREAVCRAYNTVLCHIFITF